MKNVRDAVSIAARRLTRAVDEPVGNDGLTDQERVADLVSFRTGVGRRPEMTDDLRLKLDTVSEKLFGTTHAVRRPSR